MQSGRLPGRLAAFRQSMHRPPSFRGIWDIKGQCFLSGIGCKMEMMSQRTMRGLPALAAAAEDERGRALAQLSGK